tara:strand:+ start:842 stop:1021 length:180 start_codon:yes stop_codon:yes gene_type:complete
VALTDVNVAFAVNEKQAAACFIVQNIDRKLFTVGGAENGTQGNFSTRDVETFYSFCTAR